MDTDTAKGICLAILILDTWLFGWVPYIVIHRGSRTERSAHIRAMVISYLNCFAGGVFLGACLLHLLVEGRETLDAYWADTHINQDFPVYELVVAGGFFLIAAVEQVAHKFLHSSIHKHEVFHNEVENQTPTTHNHNGIEHSDSANEIVIEREETINGDEMPYILEDEAGGEQSHMGELVEVIAQLGANRMKAFLLLMALSFHTIFDGLAVGLQTSASGIWEMFTAIIIHKSLVALCLGLQLFLVYVHKPFIAGIWVFVFSLISPIGVVIGMLVTGGHIDQTAADGASGFLQAVATGTFLYVTFFEILKDELMERRGLLRLLVAIFGFGGMALAKYFDND